MNVVDSLRDVVRIAKAASVGVTKNVPRIERAEAAIAAVSALIEAGALIQRMVDEALPKFNWGASFLDANAIKLMNEAPAAHAAALTRCKGGDS